MSVSKGHYISRLQTLLVFLILNGTAKMKLAILPFLYCGEIVKNSTSTAVGIKNYLNIIIVGPVISIKI